MSDFSTNLQLPYLMPAQAQKHVTVNESLRRLDALVHMKAQSRTTSEQPASPADGQLWITPPGKTGANWDLFADNAIAYWVDGAWEQIVPTPGWFAFVLDEDELVVFDGTGWATVGVAGTQDLFATVAADSGADVEAGTTIDTLNLAGGAGIATSGDAGSNTVTFALSDTAVAAGAYGGAGKYLGLTVDPQGRVTAAAEGDLGALASRDTVDAAGLLADGVVTPAKLADLEPGRILGRAAGTGTGAPAALDGEALRGMLDLGAAQGRALAEAVTGAAGGEGAITLLVTAEGAKTYRAGTGDEIETLAPLIGPGALGQPATTWSGDATDNPLRPVVSGTGILFGAQTGFDLPHAVLSQTGRFAIDYVFSMPATAETYDTKAEADAAFGDHVISDIIRVTGDANTSFAEDIDARYLQSGEYNAAHLVNGYYAKLWGSWADLGGTAILALSNAAGSHYLRIGVDIRGFLQAYGYDGSGGFSVRSTAVNVIAVAQEAPQHFRLEADGYETRLWLNGAEIFCFPGLFDVTDFDRVYFNGQGRGANAVLPINGVPHVMHAACVSEGLGFAARRRVSDVLAVRFGAPKQRWNPVVKAVVMCGQSNEDGARGSSDLDPASGWDGNIDREAAYSASTAWRTQEYLPGVYGTNGAKTGNAGVFGPLNIPTNIYGTPLNGLNFTVSGTAAETWEWGFFKRLFADHPQAAEHDWYCLGHAIGGATLSLMQASQGDGIWAQKGKDLNAINGTYPRDAVNGLFARLVEHCARRGQTVELVLVYQGQGESLWAADGTYGGGYETDARDWINNELLPQCGSPRQPWFILKEIADSDDDFDDNWHNAAPYYFSDQRRVLAANRDAAFRFAYLGGLLGLYGNHIHKNDRHRLLGEFMAIRFGEMEYGSGALDAGQLEVVSVAINGAGQIVVTFNQDIEAATKFPDVPAILQTGGHDTYGFVFVPDAGDPGRVIDDDVAISGATATITISGGGAVAGDAVAITGTGAPYTNIRAAAPVDGLLPDIDFSLPFGGAGGDSPLLADAAGASGTMTPWAIAGLYPVTA